VALHADDAASQAAVLLEGLSQDQALLRILQPLPLPLPLPLPYNFGVRNPQSRCAPDSPLMGLSGESSPLLNCCCSEER
jgi:hypothetical protein